jgi:hypothetical protein
MTLLDEIDAYCAAARDVKYLPRLAQWARRAADELDEALDDASPCDFTDDKRHTCRTCRMRRLLRELDADRWTEAEIQEGVEWAKGVKRKWDDADGQREGER